MTRQERIDLYADLIGSRAAGELAAMLNAIVEMWDDIIDQDKPLTVAAVNDAMRLAIIDLPTNALYRACPVEVSTVLTHALVNWHIANAFERRGERSGLEISHVLRYLGASMLAHFVLLVGGPMEKAVAVGVRSWEMTTKEPFETYLAEHGKNDALSLAA